MDLQSISAIIFIALMTIFLIKNKKKIQIQKILFPIIYFVMYRTKLGLKSMDNLAKKYPRLMKGFGYSGVIIGFLGMIFVSISLLISLFGPTGVTVVLPFKTKGGLYVPFFYWIISIFILAVVHEFSHGVISRVHGVKIKSSGFAFLGLVLPIIPAAFVEPDEKQMEKKSDGAKLSVFAAGPFSNIALAALVLLLFVVALNPLGDAMYDQDGIYFDGFIEGENVPVSVLNGSGIQHKEVIISIDSQETLDINSFSEVLQSKKPNDLVIIETKNGTYPVQLESHPNDAEKPYLGIYLKQKTILNPTFEDKFGSTSISVISWFIGLFYWLYVLNLGIGLFNLVPLGPLDGGKMMHTVLHRYFKKEKAMKIWKYVSTFFLVIILIMLLSSFLK